VIALIQRVQHAQVDVSGKRVAAIGRGVLALIGIEHHDDEESVVRLVERIIKYRIFPDENGKMNCSLRETGGALLLVPQFTLAADTSKGLRPSFTSAAEPEKGRQLYEHLLIHAQAQSLQVESGIFGADMQVSLTNDGPVTFWLQV